MSADKQGKRDLAARLVIHADNIERLDKHNPAYRFFALVKDLRTAAEKLRTATASEE